MAWRRIDTRLEFSHTTAVTASAQVPGTASGAAEKEMLQTLDAVDQATDKRDKAALERLMADEFIAVTRDERQARSHSDAGTKCEDAET